MKLRAHAETSRPAADVRLDNNLVDLYERKRLMAMHPNTLMNAICRDD